MSKLNNAEKQELYQEANLLLAHAQELLLDARAKHEQDMKEHLCYPIPASLAGKSLC